ncbi:Os07g0550100 [Oryza sativa Japonica Group]|uniref:Os07g0550100 protein n=1 Tax=Oryza sativa subsp. japonica TaxID=39947 RepID=A0A0P0X7H1_ORYSJ|nr:Os07g0550100 [Oryza sativa Japonica Group]
MDIHHYIPRIRPPAGAGAPVFAALRALTIRCSTFDSLEMERRLVSSLCPRGCRISRSSPTSSRSPTVRPHRALRVAGARDWTFAAASTAGSPSRRRQRLVRLAVSQCFHNTASVAAPNLGDVPWRDIYDPRRHLFVQAPRHVRKLKVWPALLE